MSIKLFKKIKNKQEGFTLIELLIVIGILVVLLAVALIAINPGRKVSQENDAKRKDDVNAILNAVNLYIVDRGSLPAGITAANKPISKKFGADICAALVPTYITSLPADPKTNNGVAIIDCATDYVTGYNIAQSANNKLTVSAPAAELSKPISVTR